MGESRGQRARLRGRLEAGTSLLLAGHTAAGTRPPRGARPRRQGRRACDEDRCHQARGSFLAGGQHGHARGVLRADTGDQVPRPDQRRAPAGAGHQPGVDAGIRRPGARLVVSQGAGPLRRERGDGRRTPAQGPRLQSAQYGHAVLSLRSRGRARPQGRSADAAPTGTRCADRSRLGAGRSRLQDRKRRSG